MKRILIPVYKIILPFILFAFSGCNKDIFKCEKWVVSDDTRHRCMTGFCLYGSGIKEVNICGSALKNAKAGTTIILVDGDCCKTTRLFIRKL